MGEPLDTLNVVTIDTLKQQLLAVSQPDSDGVYRAGAAKRQMRTELAMRALEQLWQDALDGAGFAVPERGLALAAVGSLARGQVGPSSDLDLVLIYDPHVLDGERLNTLANRLWYPIWDAGLDLDHAVRTRAQCESVTDKDLPAAMGWLDVRAVAGDCALVDATASSILERWRKAARKRLGELTDSARQRLERFGRLPYVNQPDVKETRGGLRDTVLTGALAASWLADRPHGRYDDAVERLLDVRDCIHLAARKDTNLLLAAYQAKVAAMLGLADPTLPEGAREAQSVEDLQTLLAKLGRTIAFSLDATASRAQRSLVHERPRFSFFQIMGPRASGRREAPTFDMLAPGVARHEGEIVLAPGVEVTADATLPLRVAVTAARQKLPINTSTLLNLTNAPIHDNAWDDESRALFLDMLGSGDALLPVWEELDFVGLPARWMPEWAAIRNRPSASAAHRYTIDRHIVEVTSRLSRTHPEYDDAHGQALLMAGILHDIGKRPGIDDHSAEGARHARAIMERMGFDGRVVRWTSLLVREHLTLSEFARGKNPNDAAVAQDLAARVGNDPVLLDILFDLTRADMSSLGATAAETIGGKTGWSKWNERLVTIMWQSARRYCR